METLGYFKWPSLLLVLSPVVAFPYWSPASPASTDCGLAIVEGQMFRIFKTVDGASVTLRPTSRAGAGAPALDPGQAEGYEAGGMLFEASNPAFAALRCPEVG